MCASSDKVQPLTPPPGSVIGDKVRWEGYTGKFRDMPLLSLHLLLFLLRIVQENIKPEVLEAQTELAKSVH